MRFKDIVKLDMPSLGLNINKWEDAASDRWNWRSTVQKALNEKEKTSKLKDNCKNAFLTMFEYRMCTYLLDLDTNTIDG